MAKKVINQDQKDARALLIVVASGALFFPQMNPFSYTHMTLPKKRIV